MSRLTRRKLKRPLRSVILTFERPYTPEGYEPSPEEEVEYILVLRDYLMDEDVDPKLIGSMFGVLLKPVSTIDQLFGRKVSPAFIALAASLWKRAVSGDETLRHCIGHITMLSNRVDIFLQLVKLFENEEVVGPLQSPHPRHALTRRAQLVRCWMNPPTRPPSIIQMPWTFNGAMAAVQWLVTDRNVVPTEATISQNEDGGSSVELKPRVVTVSEEWVETYVWFTNELRAMGLLE